MLINVSQEGVYSEYPCSDCDSEFATISTLDKHVNEYHAQSCDTSISESESEESQRENMRTVYEPVCDTSLPSELQFYCKTCNFICKTEAKLKNPICRITVRNPTFCDLYAKNWIVLNRCTPIFHRIEKK